MQVPVKSKFIPPIPKTLVHGNWAPWIILPWQSSLPPGVPGGRTAATVAAAAKRPAHDVLLRPTESRWTETRAL